MTPGQYRTRYLNNLLCLVQEQGVDTSEFAKEIGFSLEQVRERKETSRSDYESVYFAIIDHVNIPGLGIEIGRRIEPLDLSLPGLALLFSSDLGVETADALMATVRRQAAGSTGRSRFVLRSPRKQPSRPGPPIVDSGSRGARESFVLWPSDRAASCKAPSRRCDSKRK